MKPMGLNSTPFLSYHQIKTDRIDLYEDAFGLCSEFKDVIDILRLINPEPDRRVTNRLIKKIRKYSR
jgi:hypothetical protein